MDLKTYLFALPMPRRHEFAEGCGTTYGHLRNVAYGLKPCAPELAMRVERETAHVVRVESLCPNEPWHVLRGTDPAGPETACRGTATEEQSHV